jgi:hypothetical protein
MFFSETEARRRPGEHGRSTARIDQGAPTQLMPELNVDIVRFVDEAQPGVVECVLTDVWGMVHVFIDKVPIFTKANLTENSLYPQRGVIACSVLRRWHEHGDREIVTVDTSDPWHVESTEGQTQFDVLASQLTLP